MNNKEFLSNVEAVFNQARETKRFGEERYQAGVKDQANKAYAKALELNISEEVAREIAGLKESSVN